MGTAALPRHAFRRAPFMSVGKLTRIVDCLHCLQDDRQRKAFLAGAVHQAHPRWHGGQQAECAGVAPTPTPTPPPLPDIFVRFATHSMGLSRRPLSDCSTGTSSTASPTRTLPRSSRASPGRAPTPREPPTPRTSSATSSTMRRRERFASCRSLSECSVLDALICCLSSGTKLTVPSCAACLVTVTGSRESRRSW